MRILVIEDDDQLRSALKSGLEAACFAVDTAKDGKEGSYLARTNDYDLVILDYFLPLANGQIVCEEIRRSGKNCFILMLTVQTEVEKKVEMLNLGADDYVNKPCSMAELLARIQALLRRPKIIESPILNHKHISIDPQRQLVFCDKKETYLTRKEFALLEYLMRQKGRVVSRASIAEHVWDSNLDAFSNTIESHILNIRRKIDHMNEKSIIQTVPGRGYRIAEQA